MRCASATHLAFVQRSWFRTEKKTEHKPNSMYRHFIYQNVSQSESPIAIKLVCVECWVEFLFSTCDMMVDVQSLLNRGFFFLSFYYQISKPNAYWVLYTFIIIIIGVARSFRCYKLPIILSSFFITIYVEKNRLNIKQEDEQDQRWNTTHTKKNHRTN